MTMYKTTASVHRGRSAELFGADKMPLLTSGGVLESKISLTSSAESFSAYKVPHAKAGHWRAVRPFGMRGGGLSSIRSVIAFRPLQVMRFRKITLPCSVLCQWLALRAMKGDAGGGDGCPCLAL